MGQAEFRFVYIIHLNFRGPPFRSLIMHERNGISYLRAYSFSTDWLRCEWFMALTHAIAFAIRSISRPKQFVYICSVSQNHYKNENKNWNGQKWLTKWEHCRLIQLAAFVRHTEIFLSYTEKKETLFVANTLLSHMINYILFLLSLATAKFIGYINFVHIISNIIWH